VETSGVAEVEETAATLVADEEEEEATMVEETGDEAASVVIVEVVDSVEGEAASKAQKFSGTYDLI
jgi:hypothetical protein